MAGDGVPDEDRPPATVVVSPTEDYHTNDDSTHTPINHEYLIKTEIIGKDKSDGGDLLSKTDQSTAISDDNAEVFKELVPLDMEDYSQMAQTLKHTHTASSSVHYSSEPLRNTYVDDTEEYVKMTYPEHNRSQHTTSDLRDIDNLESDSKIFRDDILNDYNHGRSQLVSDIDKPSSKVSTYSPVKNSKEAQHSEAEQHNQHTYSIHTADEHTLDNSQQANIGTPVYIKESEISQDYLNFDDKRITDFAGIDVVNAKVNIEKSDEMNDKIGDVVEDHDKENSEEPSKDTILDDMPYQFVSIGLGDGLDYELHDTPADRKGMSLFGVTFDEANLLNNNKHVGNHLMNQPSNPKVETVHGMAHQRQLSANPFSGNKLKQFPRNQPNFYPNSRPTFGHNSNPNLGFGSTFHHNSGFNFGPSFRQNSHLNSRQNIRSNTGPNHGFNFEPNVGKKAGFNSGPKFDHNRRHFFGPKLGPSFNHNSGPSFGSNNGPSFDHPNSKHKFDHPEPRRSPQQPRWHPPQSNGRPNFPQGKSRFFSNREPNLGSSKNFLEPPSDRDFPKPPTKAELEGFSLGSGSGGYSDGPNRNISPRSNDHTGRPYFPPRYTSPPKSFNLYKPSPNSGYSGPPPYRNTYSSSSKMGPGSSDPSPYGGSGYSSPGRGSGYSGSPPDSYYPPDRGSGYSGSSPDRGSHYSGSSPDRSSHYSGSAPDKSSHYSGSAPDRSSHYSGSAPDRSSHYSGSPPDRSFSYSGSPPDKSFSYSGSPPDKSFSYSGSPPDKSFSYSGPPPDRGSGYSPSHRNRDNYPPSKHYERGRKHYLSEDLEPNDEDGDKYYNSDRGYSEGDSGNKQDKYYNSERGYSEGDNGHKTGHQVTDYEYHEPISQAGDREDDDEEGESNHDRGNDQGPHHRRGPAHSDGYKSGRNNSPGPPGSHRPPPPRFDKEGREQAERGSKPNGQHNGDGKKPPNFDKFPFNFLPKHLMGPFAHLNDPSSLAINSSSNIKHSKERNNNNLDEDQGNDKEAINSEIIRNKNEEVRHNKRKNQKRKTSMQSHDTNLRIQNAMEKENIVDNNELEAISNQNGMNYFARNARTSIIKTSEAMMKKEDNSTETNRQKTIKDRKSKTKVYKGTDQFIINYLDKKPSQRNRFARSITNTFTLNSNQTDSTLSRDRYMFDPSIHDKVTHGKPAILSDVSLYQTFQSTHHAVQTNSSDLSSMIPVKIKHDTNFLPILDDMPSNYKSSCFDGDDISQRGNHQNQNNDDPKFRMPNIKEHGYGFEMHTNSFFGPKHETNDIPHPSMHGKNNHYDFEHEMPYDSKPFGREEFENSFHGAHPRWADSSLHANPSVESHPGSPYPAYYPSHSSYAPSQQSYAEPRNSYFGEGYCK